MEILRLHPHQIRTHFLDGSTHHSEENKTSSHNRINQIIINPFKPNGIFCSYQLDQSISILRVVECVFFVFIKILMEPVETLISISSGSGLFAYIPQKGHYRLIRVYDKNELTVRSVYCLFVCVVALCLTVNNFSVMSG